MIRIILRISLLVLLTNCIRDIRVSGAHAEVDAGALRITLARVSENLTVLLDGHRIINRSGPTRQITINNVAPGVHALRIVGGTHFSEKIEVGRTVIVQPQQTSEIALPGAAADGGFFGSWAIAFALLLVL